MAIKYPHQEELRKNVLQTQERIELHKGIASVDCGLISAYRNNRLVAMQEALDELIQACKTNQIHLDQLNELFEKNFGSTLSELYKIAQVSINLNTNKFEISYKLHSDAEYISPLPTTFKTILHFSYEHNSIHAIEATEEEVANGLYEIDSDEALFEWVLQDEGFKNYVKLIDAVYK